MSFADNLQYARKKKGLTQEALAEMLDVSRQAVSKWEQGDGWPEAEKLLVLSDILDISLDELMGRVPRRTPQADDTFSGDQTSGVSSYTSEAGAVSDAQFSGVESYIPPQPDDPLNLGEDPAKETPEAKHNRLLLSIALVCIAALVLLALSGLK